MLWFLIKQKIFSNQLPNYDIVEDDTLHRGGQPNRHGLNELANRGIRTVINLRKDQPNEINGKLNKFNIPFNPFKPRDKVVIDFLKVIYNKKHHPVFIHCFHGADRTGTLCAIYRIAVQKWDKEKAIAEMKKYGFHWWHSNLIDYIRELDIDKIKLDAGIVEMESLSEELDSVVFNNSVKS
ncbi:MAG: dual specificity protein phosphatase family protein [Rhabdochlamydiaceae bacterium]|nr:dual specificity protein phosphatase family protein [Candidatus Amphrikana amoebophyrae]